MVTKPNQNKNQKDSPSKTVVGAVAASSVTEALVARALVLIGTWGSNIRYRGQLTQADPGALVVEFSGKPDLPFHDGTILSVHFPMDFWFDKTQHRCTPETEMLGKIVQMQVLNSAVVASIKVVQLEGPNQLFWHDAVQLVPGMSKKKDYSGRRTAPQRHLRIDQIEDTF